mgnify:CR=1 FL=1
MDVVVDQSVEEAGPLMIIALLVGLCAGAGLALGDVRGLGMWRTIYYLPAVLPAAALILEVVAAPQCPTELDLRAQRRQQACVVPRLGHEIPRAAPHRFRRADLLP